MDIEQKKMFFCDGCQKNKSIDDTPELAHPFKDRASLCQSCYNREYRECSECSKVDKIGNLFLADGENYCKDCLDKLFIICDDCDEYCIKTDSYYIAGSDRTVCEACYDERYFSCNGCGDRYNNDYYHDGGYCDSCSEGEDDDSSDINRRYSRENTYVTAGHRAYSCEIECYYPDYNTLYKVSRDLPAEIGISDDGSLENRGKEFQTPKLSGRKGDALLKLLCKTLNSNDFSVNRSCGLHIHLDTADLSGRTEKIKTLMLFYLNFEPVIYSYLPYSRRTNRFCKPLASFYSEADILKCDSLSELEQLWYREQDLENIEERKKDRYDQSRYAGVNIHSLLSNGHIELRHHSGTIDYTKIKNWLELHLTIIDGISSGKINRDDILSIKYILELSQKQDKMFEILALPDKIKNYFIARNAKFSRELKDDTNICVE